MIECAVWISSPFLYLSSFNEGVLILYHFPWCLSAHSYLPDTKEPLTIIVFLSLGSFAFPQERAHPCPTRKWWYIGDAHRAVMLPQKGTLMFVFLFSNKSHSVQLL